MCDPVSATPKRYVDELANAEKSKTRLVVHDETDLGLAEAVVCHLPLAR